MGGMRAAGRGSGHRYRVAVIGRDPLRADAYRELGIDTISPTLLGAGLCLDFLTERPWRSIDAYQAMPESRLLSPGAGGGR